MIITATIEYACLAMIELAINYPDQMTTTKIADKTYISSNYLIQIMKQLKSFGLVRSHRGANGGYSLMKPPSEISLFDIVSSVAPQNKLNSRVACLDRVWRELDKSKFAILRGATLATLIGNMSPSA